MAYNKVVYAQNVLIDLTEDTVTEKTLLTGMKAHDKTGKIIIGSLLEGYPEVLELEEVLRDSSGSDLFDSSSENIIGTVIYDRK